MELCLACHQDRLATLLDTASRLVFVRIDQDGTRAVAECLHPGAGAGGLIRAMDGQGVRTLVCGAICRELFEALQAGGLTVVPWLSGASGEVAEAVAAGRAEAYRMPGCACGRRRRRCRRRPDDSQLTNGQGDNR
jgi:predicted Fe-Mo cluster-binding NifX family protein